MSDYSAAMKSIVPTMDLDGEYTVEDYLKKLLCALWDEDEGFNSKRPFGNSGWQWDVYTALIRDGHLPGALDEGGWIEEFDEEEANRFVLDLIVNNLGATGASK